MLCVYKRCVCTLLLCEWDSFSAARLSCSCATRGAESKQLSPDIYECLASIMKLSRAPLIQFQHPQRHEQIQY